jgi:hypothetical protein
MKKRYLAKALIKRQIDGGYHSGHSHEVLRNIKDDEIIDDYVRCSSCMARIVSSDVSIYETTDDFIDTINAAIKTHKCGSTTLVHLWEALFVNINN